MFIEFVGPPGAGKTTVMKLLGEKAKQSPLVLTSFEDYQQLNLEFGEKAIMRSNFFARWLTLIKLAWRRPQLVATVSKLYFLHGTPLLRRLRKAQKLLAFFIFAERLTANCPEKIVVFHDGFLQCLWSMLIDSQSLRGQTLIQALLDEYYGEFEPLLMMLDAEDSVVSARIFERSSRGRFNKDSSPARRAEFGRWLAYHRELTGYLPAGLTMFHFAAASSPEQLAGEIYHTIEQLPPASGA